MQLYRISITSRMLSIVGKRERTQSFTATMGTLRVYAHAQLCLQRLRLSVLQLHTRIHSKATAIESLSVYMK